MAHMDHKTLRHTQLLTLCKGFLYNRSHGIVAMQPGALR